MSNLAAKVERISASLECSTRTREFISLCRAVALGKGGQRMAFEIAKEARLSGPILEILGSPHRTYDLLPSQVKAVQGAGSTTDSTWAAPLAAYQFLASAFLESLQSFGAFDRVLQRARRVPLRTRVGAATGGVTGSAVPQASVKPIGGLSLTGTTIDERKAVGILVVTQELARFSQPTAGDLFRTELSNAVAVATDAEFVTVLSNGAASFPASGFTAEHARNDLRGLLSLVTTGARSALFLLTTSAICKALSIMHTTAGDGAFPQMNYNGGQIGGIEVVPTDGAPSGTMILVDAAQLAMASDTVAVSAAGEASVQMDTAPNSPPTPAVNLISLWQNDLLGLKAERFFGCVKLTTGAAAVLTGAAYTGDSPG